jgi:hypothetical protein
VSESHLRTMDDLVTVVVITDGTHTTAEVVGREAGLPPRSLGYGTAKRRRGETRDADLGAALALSRAFEKASEYFSRAAEERL